MTSTTHLQARDDRGALVDPVSPESLRPFLLERADGRAGTVEVRAVDVSFEDGRTLTGSARATPDPAGGWTVSIATTALDPSSVGNGTGGIDDRSEARAPNTDAVYDLLRSWAADDGWWQEAFSWRRAA